MKVSFLLFVFLQVVNSLVCPVQKDANVLILGAGTAGVTAGRLLYNSGVRELRDIMILEANEVTIGGRIRNVDFKGHQIELGANWIHSAPLDTSAESATSNHPIWKLTRSNSHCYPNKKLTGEYTRPDTHVYKTSQGITLNVTNDIKEYENALEEAEKLPEQPNYIDINVRQGLMGNGWNPPTGDLTKELVEWLQFDFDYGDSPSKSSLSLIAKNEEFHENKNNHDYLITDQRGYVSLLRCLAKPLEDNMAIKLGHEVESIDWNDECVCAQVTGRGQVCGNYGIVTFSTGVLKNWVANSRFNGTLSSSKKRAIDRSNMGLYLKLFLYFPSSFSWDESEQTNYTYILRSDTRGYYPIIQPISTSPNIILMTVTGDQVRRITNDNLSKEQIIDEIMVVLREFYPGKTVPRATNLMYHNWYTDPLFRGMYTNDPFGLTTEDRKNMAIPEGPLYFSGEGNSLTYAGTVHGAYCSGIDTAVAIMGKMGTTPEYSFLPPCPSSTMVTPTSSGCTRCTTCATATKAASARVRGVDTTPVYQGCRDTPSSASGGNITIISLVLGIIFYLFLS